MSDLVTDLILRIGMPFDVAQFHRARTIRNRYGALKHGASMGGRKSKEYRAWSAMKQRCLNPRCAAFGLYGGRGITVCPRWLESFVNFLTDMGQCPLGKSLDRINNNGNYEPSNCRWATQKEQTNNTRVNRRLMLNGIALTMTQWAAKARLLKSSLRSRLKRGWSLSDAITVPPLGKRRLYWKGVRRA